MKKVYLIFAIIFMGIFSVTHAGFLPPAEDDLLLNLIENDQFKEVSSDIKHQRGYSSDTSSLAPAVCFQAVNAERTQQQAILNLDFCEDASSVAKSFGVDASLSITTPEFGADGFVSYLNSIKEDDFSVTFSYYYKVIDLVKLEYSYDADTMLTEVGKNIYKNGTNPYFRVLCGDRLISSYSEGAALIMSMKLSFNSKTEKSIFKARVGGSLFSFIEASAKVRDSISRYSISGSLAIQAQQLGGDPTQLSKILPDKLVCNLNSIEGCQNIATSLIAYAKNEFPSQFQIKEGGIWAGPLVAIPHSYSVDFSLSDIGMELTPSFITPEVKKAREELIMLQKNTELAQKNLHAVRYYFPVPLGQSTISSLDLDISNAQHNMDILLKGVDSGPASDCWLRPWICLKISQEILANKKPLMFSMNDIRPFCNDPTIYYTTTDVCPCNPDRQYGFKFDEGNFRNTMREPDSSGRCWAKIHFCDTADGCQGYHTCGPIDYPPDNTWVWSYETTY